MPLCLAVCDDNHTHLKYTQALVLKSLNPLIPEIECFDKPENLLYAVETDGYAPQIAILDIEMENLNGIDLAHELAARVPGCCIIFLSGYSEYVSDVYSTEHIFFILKDKAEQYIKPALDKALDIIAQKEDESVVLSFRGNSVTIPVKDIVYVESSLRKLSVHTMDKTYAVYCQLGSFFSARQGESFFRCNQSYLVNLRYVKGITDGNYLLSTGESIPISRSHLKEAKERFFNYAGS